MFVAAGLSAAVWGYFYLKQNKKPALNALDVLPHDAVCLVEVSGFHELTNKLINQNLIWNGLINIKQIKSIESQISYFDSLTTQVENFKEFFRGRKINLGFYNEKQSLRLLMTFNLQELAQEEEFQDILKTNFKCEVGTEGQLEFWKDRLRYTIQVSNGVVAISESEALVKKCFNAGEKKLSKEIKFIQLRKNLDEDDLCNVYLNYDLLKKSHLKINTNQIALTGVSVAKLEVTPEAIVANGFNDTDTSSFLNALSGQPAKSGDFFSILPFNLLSYKATAISNYPLLKEKLKVKSNANYWKQANDSALFNVERQLAENINEVVVECEYALNANTEKALVIHIKDSARVNEALNYLSDSIMNYQGLRNFKLRDSISDFNKEFFGDLYEAKAQFAFAYSNYLIISESLQGHLFYMSSVLNNSSATQNEVFMNYAKENLLVDFNYQVYCNINKQSYKAKDLFSFLSDSDLVYVKKVSDYSINISNYKNLLQFRAAVKYQSASSNKDAPGLWTCEADTLITSQVTTFINHKSSQNELLFQDAKSNLYLTSATGNIIWKKNIGEKSLSPFYTVDAFKNNKYQILFNTSTHLHLIDRNGNYVPGYPLKLPSSATNPLSLQDYDKTKDYRIIIACADNKIYNYNINGTKNEKFTPIQTEHPVYLPVKYVKVGASDYLIANDSEGKIYVYSRRGEGRIDLSNKLITNSSDYFIDAANNIQNTNLIYFDDKNSLLEKVSLEDKKDIAKLNADFENPSYFFELIDDDKKTDIVIIDKSKLVCYDLMGNELFRHETADEAFTTGTYYYDTDGMYFFINTINGNLEIVQAGLKKVVKRIRASGKPLVFDLFKDGKKYLLVTDNNTLKCVLLK